MTHSKGKVTLVAAKVKMAMTVAEILNHSSTSLA